MNKRGWGASELAKKRNSGVLSRQDFIAKAKLMDDATMAQLKAHGAPNNWRFLNVGVSDSAANVTDFGKGYSNAHLHWLNSSKNPTAQAKRAEVNN